MGSSFEASQHDNNPDLDLEESRGVPTSNLLEREPIALVRQGFQPELTTSLFLRIHNRDRTKSTAKDRNTTPP